MQCSLHGNPSHSSLTARVLVRSIAKYMCMCVCVFSTSSKHATKQASSMKSLFSPLRFGRVHSDIKLGGLVVSCSCIYTKDIKVSEK